jgi:sarcosine oxidase subunit gamma
MSDPIMTDFELIHRPVLGPVTPVVAERIRLEPLPEGTVLQVFGPVGHIASLMEAAKRAGLDMRANGPGLWYLVGDEPAPPAAKAELTAGLSELFSVIDQSHGRVRIAIEGEVVEEILAKGTGIDLDCFGIGQSTTTLIGHVSAHMTRTAKDRFELMAQRGFTESLWHDLVTMAAEYTAS